MFLSSSNPLYHIGASLPQSREDIFQETLRLPMRFSAQGNNFRKKSLEYKWLVSEFLLPYKALIPSTVYWNKLT